ncbi:MAG: hypothetical protein ABW046_22725 [Actinoplanes sp.]
MTQPTYYRVQPADRDIMDGAQTSRAWHRAEDEPQPTDRAGVSACRSLEDLAEYLATRGEGIPYGLPGWCLVALHGEVSDDQPLDFEQGEVLVHPTRIVSCEPIPDAFFDMIGAAYDAANG